MMARKPGWDNQLLLRVWKKIGERVAKKEMTITPGTPGFIGGKVDDISKVDEKHDPCTGQEWEHCYISPSTADLISQIL